MKSLKPVAIVGNTLYILWIVYNGVDEGFRAVGSVQAIALIGLVLLLALNLFLLRKRK